ncbi:MAG: hypothetical protein IJ833_04345 [Lachnospiraceae bacterium]|nr:hypothetical protein [Lachnospiraceae bacterium]
MIPQYLTMGLSRQHFGELYKNKSAHNKQLSQKCLFNAKNADISGLNLVELGYNNIVGEYRPNGKDQAAL